LRKLVCGEFGFFVVALFFLSLGKAVEQAGLGFESGRETGGQFVDQAPCLCSENQSSNSVIVSKSPFSPSRAFFAWN